MRGVAGSATRKRFFFEDSTSRGFRDAGQGLSRHVLVEVTPARMHAHQQGFEVHSLTSYFVGSSAKKCNTLYIPAGITPGESLRAAAWSN